MRKKLKYAVLLLNYNTVESAILAGRSIVENAKSNNYIICFIDNLSSKEDQVDIFRQAAIPNSITLQLKENSGYAKGNNAGVCFLKENFDVEYFVIMNPDVEVQTVGMIDSLIDKLQQLDQSYCGIQPLILTPKLNMEANMQICIRKVYTYFDCLIDVFFPLKKIFVKRYNRQVYFEERPYNTPVDFEVPSGCFFIIKADVFDQIGMFDERTFLYTEEIILGFKLKEQKYKFLLAPSFYVIHEGGKSTGEHTKRLSWFVKKESLRSLCVYLKYYLKCNTLQILLLKFLFLFNFGMKVIVYHLNLFFKLSFFSSLKS